MALDTNIALGIRPVEQPNMLAQMGQMMQMRQMQQGYESENALRDFYAQGGDISTDEGKRRLMSKVGLKGMDIIGKQSEISARDIGTAEKSLELYKNQVGFIKSPEDAARWLSNFYANPKTRPYVESVAPMDVALAAIPKNDPAAFQAWLRNASLKAEKLFVDANTEATNKTRIQAALLSAAPGHRQASLAEQESARKQQERDLVRSILNGKETPSVAPPTASNAPMGGGGGRLGSGTFNIPMGGAPTGAATKPNVLATQVAPLVTTPPPVNALLNPPAGQTGVAPAANRINEITRQLTQLAKIGGPDASQAMEGLVKEYNVLNPAGKIDIGQDGILRTINERSGVATIVTGPDGKPVKGNVAPIVKSVLDQTDPAGKRMIDVNVNEYVQGTGLGADGKGAAPKGVIGISNSQIPPNYMPDPKNPQGVIPVPGSLADPSANLQIGYRQRADGTGQEFIPGGPADPKAAALLRGPRAGYKLNAEGDEVRIPQTGVPEGLRLKPDERWNETKQVVEQVPGSAAFIEQQKKHAKDLNAVKTAQATTKWGIDRINTILNPKNKSGFEGNFGGFNAYITERMSGNTATVKSELDSLKSELKEKGLQLFRTGGSIGAITEKEWPILEGMIASLNPKLDEDAARNILEKIRIKFKELETLASENYDDQWQGTQYHKPLGANRPAPASGSGIDTSNKFLQ